MLDAERDFMASRLDKIEQSLNLFSNTTKTADRISSGTLLFDLTAGGGLSLFSVIAGQEASGKSTQAMHATAEAVKLDIPFKAFWDAEGTLNIDYASNIWSPFGLDLQQLMDDPRSGFRYYRSNVIERCFDFLVKTIKSFPDKVWLPEQETWAYAIPKRDDYFSSYMKMFELKADKSLTTDTHFICPTDDSRNQGLISIDSLAAMMTNEDDENDKVSNRRAREATAFSTHLKRVMGLLPDKQFVLLGTNQLRVIPGVSYGDPYTEPGGNAIQFYSSMRWRTFSRAVPTGYKRDPDNSKQSIEPSVQGSGHDNYMYKELINTKNKLGRPLIKGSYRVWVSDREGIPHGIDPVYDVLQYLLKTLQATERGDKIVFKLRESAGPIREILNGKTLSYTTFKTMILGEVFSDVKLIRRVADELAINKKLTLRAALFKQLKRDKSVYSTVNDTDVPVDEKAVGKRKRSSEAEEI